MDSLKTDDQLRTDVQQELEWEPSIDAGSIGVAVEDGIVTLTGNVSSYSEKLTAENAAERVAGIKAVSDELEVRLPDNYARTDTDIARAAVQALSWNIKVPEDQIKLRVDHGFITMQGEVNYQFQKEAAEHAVAHLIGVTGLANQITVRPKISAAANKEQIEKALERSADVYVKRISVEAIGNTVTLRGTVHTWGERDAAEAVAWRAPGVYQVNNEIKIVN